MEDTRETDTAFRGMHQLPERDAA